MAGSKETPVYWKFCSETPLAQEPRAVLHDALSFHMLCSAAEQPIHRSAEQPEPGSTREYCQRPGNSALIVGLQSCLDE